MRDLASPGEKSPPPSQDPLPAVQYNGNMDNSSTTTSTSFEVPETLTTLLHWATEHFHRLPGSAILLRYIKSSHQNDPVRSALELFLVIFAIRYLLAPKYSTKASKVVLTEDVSLVLLIILGHEERVEGMIVGQRIVAKHVEDTVADMVVLQEIDELVEDWTPEPLVGKITPFEEQELEKRQVIVGYVVPHLSLCSHSEPNNLRKIKNNQQLGFAGGHPPNY